MPDRINTTSRRKVLAVSMPPLSEKEMDRVLDISGRQMGVTTPLVANIMKPPQEARSSLVNWVFRRLSFSLYGLDGLIKALKKMGTVLFAELRGTAGHDAKVAKLLL